MYVTSKVWCFEGISVHYNTLIYVLTTLVLQVTRRHTHQWLVQTHMWL